MLARINVLIGRLICIVIIVNLVRSAEQETGQKRKSSNEASEEFSHLLDKSATSRRVHLISELTRNGHRLQIEEYVDLETWNQLIQFKWHEESPSKGDGESNNLATVKVNVVIFNTKSSNTIMIQYEPFSCDFRPFEDTRAATATSAANNNNKTKTKSSDWKELMESSLADKPDDLTISSRQRHMRTIATLLSSSPNSPYSARMPIHLAPDVWLFGIAGLWARAQFPDSAGPPSQLYHFENKVKIKDSNSWRFVLDSAGIIVNYYFGGGFLNNVKNTTTTTTTTADSTAQLSNAEYEYLSLIELRNLSNPHVLDMINVVDIDFNFSNRLLEDLFKLPIGFNCPANPTCLFESSVKNYFNLETFDTTSRSFLLEFELVATKYSGLNSIRPLYLATDIKTLTWAASKHPINAIVPLMMYEIREDRTKSIRDFHTKLRYIIRYDHFCEISKLHLFDFDHKQAYDPVEVRFDAIEITLSLSETILDYIFDPKISKRNEMRLLNRIKVSPKKEEFVFESQVPEHYEHIVSITDSATKKNLIHRLSIVRVYERSSLQPRKLMKLVRVILLVFDYSRVHKLAEIRLNLIKKLDSLTFTRRARLFDISSCSNREESSMDLMVTYPADSNLIAYAQDKGHQLVEEFYKSSINWWLIKNEPGETSEWNSTKLEKKRLALSLNFFRIPKVELLNSVEGELELHLTIIDKPSPLDSFAQIEESTFLKKEQDELMLVETVKECAKFCQQLQCQMFAYDSRTHECKLSPLTFDDPSLVDGDLDSVAITVRRAFSKIYYAQSKIDSIDWQAPADEASLAELYSYLEHSANEYSNFDGDDDGENDSILARAKRSPSITKSPLLSFQFTDRNSGGQFEPPVRRTLVPSELRVLRLPTILDVSSASQSLKLAKAFRAREQGSFYRLTELDDFASVPREQLTADERTFRMLAERAYYTLKRSSMREANDCARACYNLEDWDKQKAAEQACVSYSYCHIQKQCVLVIKTDFAFIDSLKELVQEGDIMHDINSTKQLEHDQAGCIINDRKYMSGFVGPYVLNDNFVPGEKGSKSLNSSLNLEWLANVRAESDLSWTEEGHEECARNCTKLNRSDQMCVAFDFCNMKTLSSSAYSSGSFSTRPEGYICKLLLLRTEDTSKIGAEISSLRGQLIRRLSARRAPKQATGNANDEKAKPPINSETRERQPPNMLVQCNRYLVSNLKEFDPLRHKQLNREFEAKLNELTPALKDVDIETCASECSVRQWACLAFEYCSKLEGRNRVQSCYLVGFGPDELGSNTLSRRNLTDFIIDVGSNTSYNKDCHVYLRGSLRLFGPNGQPLDADEAAEEAKLSTIRSHFMLVLVFLAFYFGVLFVLFQMIQRLEKLTTRRPTASLVVQLNTMISRGQD